MIYNTARAKGGDLPNTIPRPNGDAVRYYRARLGLSQSDLAELAEVAPGSVVNLESTEGRVPRPATLRRVARALGVEVAALYDAPPDLEPRPLDEGPRLFEPGPAGEFAALLEDMEAAYAPPGTALDGWTRDQLEHVAVLIIKTAIAVADGMEDIALSSDLIAKALRVTGHLIIRLEPESRPGGAATEVAELADPREATARLEALAA
jgi:transcriptional regulator with XRE-family HTH domain